MHPELKPDPMVSAETVGREAAVVLPVAGAAEASLERRDRLAENLRVTIPVPARPTRHHHMRSRRRQRGGVSVREN